MKGYSLSWIEQCCRSWGKLRAGMVCKAKRCRGVKYGPAPNWWAAGKAEGAFAKSNIAEKGLAELRELRNDTESSGGSVRLKGAVKTHKDEKKNRQVQSVFGKKTENLCAYSWETLHSWAALENGLWEITKRKTMTDLSRSIYCLTTYWERLSNPLKWQIQTEEGRLVQKGNNHHFKECQHGWSNLHEVGREEEE